MTEAHACKADGLTEAQIRRGLRAQGVPDRLADWFLARHSDRGTRKTGAPGVSRAVRAAAIEAQRVTETPFSIVRNGDSVELVVYTPPRTSKNSRRGLYRHSAAYAGYRSTIIDAVAPECGHLSLPLPERCYNLAAVFYVDRRGEPSDLFGLLQGLADAVQAAGIVTDDWQFRTVDGSRVVIGDDQPRVAATITPTEG